MVYLTTLSVVQALNAVMINELWIRMKRRPISRHCPETRIVYIVTDLISALPANRSVNTVQHATVDEAVFSM
jgi:hypothetical protein